MSDKTTTALAAEQADVEAITTQEPELLPAATLDELEQVDLGTVAEGELTSRSYEDKDGNRRKAVEVTVDSVHFCDSKKDGGQSSGSDFADPGYSEGSGDFAEIEDNGDLPF